jgi:hypothetical protein
MRRIARIGMKRFRRLGISLRKLTVGGRTLHASSGIRLNSTELEKDGMARELLGITVACLRPVNDRCRLNSLLLSRYC